MAFKLVQNKFYEIRPVKDLAKIVHVGWDANSNGDTFEVQSASQGAGDWRKFLIYPLDLDHYAIVNKNSAKLMKVSRDDNNNGRWIEIWDWLPDEFGQARESVYFQSVGNDYFALQYKGTGKYMTLHNRSTDDGNLCVQWEWENGNWQHWKVTPLTEGITLPTAKTAPPPVAPDYSPVGGINQILPEKSETVTTNYALLPYFMVDDPHYSDSLKKFQSNPYYLLLKKQYYAKVTEHILAPGEEISYIVKSGIKETEQRQFEVTVDMSIGADLGLKFKKNSLSLSLSISAQIKTLVSTTVEESKEVTVNRIMKNDSTTPISRTLYQLATEYQVIRSNGTALAPPWTVKNSNTVTRSYPNV